MGFLWSFRDSNQGLLHTDGVFASGRPSVSCRGHQTPEKYYAHAYKLGLLHTGRALT